MMSKIIKKIAKLLAYLILILFMVPVMLSGILQMPKVQDFAVSKTLNLIGEELGTDLKFSSVRITTLNRIRFKDLFIADQTGDTLFYAVKAKAVMPAIFSFLFTSDPVTRPLKKLEFEKSIVNFSIDSTNNLNFKFILDYLQSHKKSDKKTGVIKIDRIKLLDSRFALTLYNSPVDSIGIDFGNLRLNNLDCDVTNLVVKGDTLSFRIQPLSFAEESGFTIDNLTSSLELCKTYMHFTDLQMYTPNSVIHAKMINLDFSDYKDFSPQYLFDSIMFQMQFDESLIDFIDIGYFTDFFYNYSQKINLAGQLIGTLTNIKGKQLVLGWGSSSYLSGDFDIQGLPEIDETFLYFDINNLITTTKDIAILNLPGNSVLDLPEFFNNIENITYKGNFTGFFNDFVAYGKLKTNLGIISTDMMFTPDSLNSISLSGKITTENFLIGKLLHNDKIVKDISMDLAITGSYSKNNPLIAELHGTITKLTLKDYPYQNIRVNGKFSDKSFNGEIKIDDPNLIMEFKGLVDMASELPKFNFRVNTIDANLFALNISDADPEYHASFLLTANTTGRNLDEMNGEFNLLNSLFSKTDKQIQIYDLNVMVRNDADLNRVTVRSELFDADISGDYSISRLKNEFNMFFSQYIPAIFKDQEFKSDSSINSHFTFDITFKQTQPFFEFFFPDYLIAESSKLQGTFRPENENLLSVTLISPELKIKNNSMNGIVINIDSDDSAMYSSLGSQSFNLNKKFDLKNFTLKSSIVKNDISFNTRWLNWDSTLNKGSVSGHALFHESNLSKLVTLTVNPSAITISDSVWYLNNFAVEFDTAGISIDSLRIIHHGQYMTANGTISESPEDTLYFSFNNFDLANLNFLTRKQDIEFSGRLNGTGNLTGMKTNPLFFAALGIDSLIFNGEEFGNCIIRSLWDNQKQSLNIYTEAKRGKLTMLKLEGDYFPSKNGKMDFNITLNKLKTNIINPFMEGIFSDFRGLISGDLHLTGFKENPVLTGNLELIKNAFTIDYLKTRYNFTTEVEIANNNFILNNIEIFDQEGNYGILNGVIRTEYLKDISLNLGITMYNLLCMNTVETDNDMFFGTAYATGSIKIKGPSENLSFDINAETNKNTRVYIPLSQSSEVTEYNYISFSRVDTSNTKDNDAENIQKVDFSGIQMNFNLNVTPEAEVQIIFDPTMGDIIKARGSGEMVLSINTLGTFDMVGEYSIEKGEYLFTLQNVINKRLKIDPGSTLRWTGDPFNAVVDITAVYRTKAPLTDLFGTSADAELSQERATVDCRIFLTGYLMSPTVRYDIHLPFSDEETRNRVSSKIRSEEELSKQFLSLMVMNRFYFPNQYSGEQSNEGYMAGVSNASELLSNQFSNWLSQISNDFDLGFTYRPGNDITPQEVEFALSTQLLNDRLSINGSVDMKTNAAVANSEAIAGDFDLDYKLNDKGKIRLRAFNRSNDNQLSNRSPNTQGVGIFYKEEFNSFGELMNRYWATLTGKRKKMKPEESDSETK